MGQTEQDKFKTGLDKFKSKQYNQSDNIEVLNKLPKQFYNLGYNIDQPLYLNMNKLENIMKEPKGTVNGVNQHGITMDIIEKLPKAINQPLNIIKNPKFRNRFVIVTDLTDQYGDIIVVPIELNHENAEVQGISKINSIYGKETYDLPKDNSNRSYMEQNKDNIVYDIDNNRSGSSNYRLQLSSETTNAPSNVDTINDVSTSNNIISQNEKNNNNFEEKNTDNSQEKFFDKKKILNPTEIGNLNEEDANTTPNLNKKYYEKGRKQSSFYSNIVNDSKFINEDWRQELSKEENIKYYKEITNEDTLAKAYKSLNEDGKNATLNWFNKNSQNASAEDVAKGWILLKQYQDKGNYESAVEVAKKMREMGTKAGQTVQAYNILSRLTPEGMFYYVQSELSEAYNKIVEGKSKKWIDENKTKFDLTPTETQFIMDNMKEIANMEDGREKKIKLAEIQKLVQDKIPPTAGQGIKAWMRISMLLNPKTLHRNFFRKCSYGACKYW